MCARLVRGARLRSPSSRRRRRTVVRVALRLGSRDHMVPADARPHAPVACCGRYWRFGCFFLEGPRLFVCLFDVLGEAPKCNAPPRCCIVNASSASVQISRTFRHTALVLYCLAKIWYLKFSISNRYSHSRGFQFWPGGTGTSLTKAEGLLYCRPPFSILEKRKLAYPQLEAAESC